MARHRFTPFISILTFVITLVFLATGLSQTDTPLPQKTLDSLVKDWNNTLDRTEKNLLKPDVEDDTLDKLRAEISGLRLQAISRADAAMPEAAQIGDELKALGTPPAEGAPPESPSLTAKRKLITDRLSVAEGTIKEAELVIARADRILDKLSSLRRTRFTERLMSRSPSPLSPNVWKKALAEIAADGSAIRQQLEAWNASTEMAVQAPRFGIHLSLAVTAALIMVWPLRLWLLRRFGYIGLQGEPSHAQRLRTALFTGFIRILLPTAAVVAVYLTIANSGLLSASGRTIALTVLVALIFVFFVTAFCRAALAPFEPEWRIFRIGDVGARSVSLTLTALAITFAVDRVADELGNQYGASLEVTIVHKFLSGLAIAGLLLLLLRRRNWQPGTAAGGDEAAAARPPWQGLRYLLALLVLAIPVSALLGFVALSRVLATQFVLTAGLYTAVILTRAVTAEFIEQALNAETALGARLHAALSLTEEGSEMLRFWITEAIGIFIIAIGLIALMLLWGAGRDDLSSWLYGAFFGIKLGNITISLADVLLGALLFIVLLTLTRLLQRTLEHRIFPRTRLDAGLRNSIRSGAGYLGFVIAAAAAVSAIGVDMSNLAIIAGALSVGIGFGLQNIVNNFVSGLILLVERPIKVGDWIVVGDYQGYVKNISVRATEVSTFDQASVFIPNSSLIANSVMNRTYADKLGRVQIPVGVAYGTDTKKVRDQLYAVASAHHNVKRTPAPVVLFKGFGDSSLDFELIAIVNDVDKVKLVSSDLCFAIDEAFRKAGIAIPFPQREVALQLKDEQLQSLLAALGSR